ncbi:MAG TPA: YegS/Rv2252/BmrU family lipid kinase [Spirochaetia bacterium]|nr:YegS/Rv2252/BmrU family lipid kinase [Spirochaetia bacterium]
MEKERYKVIVNPIAGKGKAAERIPEIEAYLRECKLDFEIQVTKDVWHAAELAREAGREGFTVVVSGGGDGTANEVINGLMLAKERGDRVPALGVLSIGRGNDFSYGADIPNTLSSCIEVLSLNRRRPLDVGKVKGGFYPEGRYFGNGIGVGFDTIVGLEAAKLTHVHGFMAYVIGAFRTFIMYPEAPEVSVSFDSMAIEQQSHQISIMNGKRMGGTFFMAPDAVNYDGLFDLCMAERVNRREMISLIARYTKGTQILHPKIKTARSARYDIYAPAGGLVVHADGETICTDGKELSVQCLPGELTIICDLSKKVTHE